MPLAMQPVKSKAVSHIGYDPTSKTLRVRYANGGLYEATGVEAHEYAALMAADSLGKHVNLHFRAKLTRAEE